MALVDDCIKERWQTKKTQRIHVPLTSVSLGVDYASPKAFVQNLFRAGRRHNPVPAPDHHFYQQAHDPQHRYAHAIPVY